MDSSHVLPLMPKLTEEKLRSKKVIAFDLDDTLAPSKQRMSETMRAVLCRLMQHAIVAITSGGLFEQFEKQVLDGFMCEQITKGRLVLLPTSGGAMYRYYDGAWHQEYASDLSPKEVQRTMDAFYDAFARASFAMPEKTYGERIENRTSQVTMSALGQDAPAEEKRAWDPDMKKRTELREYMLESIPDLSVRIGGTTSIDVTKKGVDKGYGMKQLMAYYDLTPEEVLFVGDKLQEGGNDYPARTVGVEALEVANEHETEKILDPLLRTLGY